MEDKVPIKTICVFCTLILDTAPPERAHYLIDQLRGPATQQAVTIEIYSERGSGFYCDLPKPSVKFLDMKVHKQNPLVWGVHALQRSLAGFTKWIQDDKPYLTSAQEALPVLAAIDGVYRSAERGYTADIDHL